MLQVEQAMQLFMLRSLTIVVTSHTHSSSIFYAFHHMHYHVGHIKLDLISSL